MAASTAALYPQEADGTRYVPGPRPLAVLTDDDDGEGHKAPVAPERRAGSRYYVDGQC